MPIKDDDYYTKKLYENYFDVKNISPQVFLKKMINSPHRMLFKKIMMTMLDLTDAGYSSEMVPIPLSSDKNGNIYWTDYPEYWLEHVKKAKNIYPDFCLWVKMDKTASHVSTEAIHVAFKHLNQNKKQEVIDIFTKNLGTEHYYWDGNNNSAMRIYYKPLRKNTKAKPDESDKNKLHINMYFEKDFKFRRPEELKIYKDIAAAVPGSKIYPEWGTHDISLYINGIKDPVKSCRKISMIFDKHVNKLKLPLKSDNMFYFRDGKEYEWNPKTDSLVEIKRRKYS